MNHWPLLISSPIYPLGEVGPSSNDMLQNEHIFTIPVEDRWKNNILVYMHTQKIGPQFYFFTIDDIHVIMFLDISILMMSFTN